LTESFWVRHEEPIGEPEQKKCAIMKEVNLGA
jgi:hypothetical protein